jgi:hypothetical protein
MSSNHIDISGLKAALSTKTDLPLEFRFDGMSINSGYHVTEVRHAVIHSVDCGKNSGIDQWDEITIQLLDGSADSTKGQMSAGKFLAIVDSAMNSLQAESAPSLFFEFAPDNGPIRKLSIASIEHIDSKVAVSLGSEHAVCKPFQRAKEASAGVLSGITEPASGDGCCAVGTRLRSSGCC